MLDYGEDNYLSFGNRIAKEKESLMDVLAALLTSEEFRCIVASETGFSKYPEEPKYSEFSDSKSNKNSSEEPPIISEKSSTVSRGDAAKYMIHHTN